MTPVLIIFKVKLAACL